MHYIKKLIKLFIIFIIIIYINFSSLNKKEILLDDFKLDETIDLSAIAMKAKEEKPVVVEPKKEEKVKTNPIVSSSNLSRYSGSLTGYSADCPLCSGRLACSSYNVYKNGVVTYPDKIYGNVRIVASSKQLPCGSIVRFNSNRISNELVYAIVLDRGVRGNNLDILVESESIAYSKIGRSTINYEVVRRGW